MPQIESPFSRSLSEEESADFDEFVADINTELQDGCTEFGMVINMDKKRFFEKTPLFRRRFFQTLALAGWHIALETDNRFTFDHYRFTPIYANF